jgi:hypothetical protein
VIVGILLAWCLYASVSGLRLTLARDADPIAELEAEFKWFGPYLPPYAVVGYLEKYDGTAGSLEAVRMHYAAQYALAPRVVVGRVGPEYLIVARGTARPDGDSRLAGFSRVTTFPSGHSLYRRTP